MVLSYNLAQKKREFKNLGVIFDSDNSFDNHISKVFQTCYCHLRDLWQIHKSLRVQTAILVVNAMVSSHLDYCDSLFYEVSKSNIAKLRRVQNALCHIVFRLDRMNHVTSYLKKTPLASNSTLILFKYNLLVFKCYIYGHCASALFNLSFMSIYYHIR